MSSSSEQHNLDIHAPLPGPKIQNLEKMNDEEFWSYARQQARIVPELPSHAEYLECKLNSENCLIPLHDLAEVLPSPRQPARLPGMPTWMVGIMAWRGETIAIVNLDLYLFPGNATSRAADGMLLVASQNGQTLGLLVPALGFTSTIEFEQIAPLTTPTGFALADDGGIVEGVYTGLPILNIPALLARLVQQIGMAINHG